MADQGEFRRPYEGDGDEGEVDDPRRVAPGRRTLTQTMGGAPGSGATASPGKIALTHRLPMDLPYRGEMESAFGQDFSGVEAHQTTREALGGAGGMAQGETVAFAGTPSKHTVAHELAHVVQHRQGLTQGQALADTGKTIYDVVAEQTAAALASSHKRKAKLPRPTVLEILGDRFNVTFDVNWKDEPVFKVQYVGPFEVGGSGIQDRTVTLSAPRAEGAAATELDVSVLKVHDHGIVFDLTGAGTELSESTFDSRPHESDGNARTHFLHAQTNNKVGVTGHQIFRLDILLPSVDRPAPAGASAQEIDAEKTATAQVSLGPDAFTLVARRFGESKKVHLHFEGTSEHQVGLGNLLIPIASEEGPVSLAILSQQQGSIEVDLDGDGKMDARLVHTAGVDDVEPDGTQDHIHYLDAFDGDKFRVAHAMLKVRGKPWQVPVEIDNLKNPPPDSASAPLGRAPEQGNSPTEGSKPVQLASGNDWELRIDADGDRQKELLLRFHQKDSGKPVGVDLIQVSTGASSHFEIGTSEDQSPSFLDPVVVRAADGVNEMQVDLFSSLGYRVIMNIAAPVEDAEGRSHKISAYGPNADIRSLSVQFGELADPFLLTLEHNPQGLVFGIAGLNPDGSPGSTSGHALQPIKVSGLKLVDGTPTQAGVDLDGDDKADIVIHDAIGQQIGTYQTSSLIVARYHQMSLSGAALAGGASGAHFEVRGHTFLGTSGSDDVSRAGAGAASAVTAISAQEKEGSDIKLLSARFRAGVSAQVMRAAEKGFLSEDLVSAWKGLSEEMIRLDAFRQMKDKKPEIIESEKKVREAATGHATTVYAELKAATAKEPAEKRYDKDLPMEAQQDAPEFNPYTGEQMKYTGQEVEGIRSNESWEVLKPGPAAGLSQAIAASQDVAAAQLWEGLQGGVERWAQKKLERELGEKDPLVQQGKYMAKMGERLGEIKNKKKVQRVYATFIADESYRKEEGFFQSLPLQLWCWQDDDSNKWYIRDLTNPEKPFDGSATPEYKRVCNPAVDRPDDVPPHSLFEQLNDSAKYPKGLIRYQIPGTHWADQVKCTADKKWYQWVQEIGLAIAAVGLILATAGAAGGLVALVGSYCMAGAMVAGAVGAAGELADAYEHGWIDGTLVLIDLLQIVGGVASAGSIVAGNLVKGATVAAEGVAAGKEGAAAWSGRLAKLAAMADKAYIPLTATGLAADISSVVVMSVDVLGKLKEIDENLPKEQATDAKIKLLAMLAMTGGLTVLSIKGQMGEILHGRAQTIVLDQVKGVPVAYTGGVRAGGVEINVSPRMGVDGKPIVDPNLHASARWQTRDASVKGLTEEEMPWYREWMAQKEKVTFKDGQPEINMPKIPGKEPPVGLKEKLTGMVKTTDVALYDAAWARTSGLEELRAANGGHLDIDPTSPIWPAERVKLKDKLAHSLGSERKAEEMLSRYEQFRGGATGAGEILHANQAAKLGQVVPKSEVDELRKLFPECQVYVSGSSISEGSLAKLDAIDVVVVVPKGTTPDLMGAIEQRAAGTRLRPDPDYAKAHAAQGMNENSTLGVNVKAVTEDQFFGMATARVKGQKPLEFHRLDVPTDSSGRAYTKAELEAMNKAGYEYDTATGQFRLRDALSRGVSAVGKGRILRGNNTVVGVVPSETVGEEVLKKLSAGEAEAFRVVGVEPPPDFDPRVKEWGIGQREDGSWVLVEGGADAVNWGQVPGVKARGHSHPLELNGQPRYLKGTGGRKFITIDELRTGKAPPDDLMALCPSGSDLAMAARDGKHLVATPYVHLGNGQIGNPVAGHLDDTIVFEILHAEPIGVRDIGQTVWYKSYVKVKAGETVLYEGPMWGGQVDLGNVGFSEVSFKEPTFRLEPVPAGTPRGAWRAGAPAVPGTTGTNADEIAKARTQTIDERRKILGTDPIKGYVDHEALVGAEIESKHGWFKRDPTADGEWISLTTGKSYDLCGFPASALPHVKVSEFTKSIKKHFLKSIDYIVVDIRGLSAAKQTEIKAYIAANHAGEGVYPSGRLLLLE